MKLELITYPNDVLRKKCTAVEEITDEIKAQLEEMARLMYANSGCGLAAPQAGLSLRMIVVNAMPHMPVTFAEHKLINPEITETSGRLFTATEGCLSLPGVRKKRTRPGKVTFTALTPDGTGITRTWTGLKARILQHEIDHLDGILIID